MKQLQLVHAGKRIIPKLLLVLTLCCTASVQVANLLAQGTAFTYQGRLDDGGTPANGNYDFRFVIFDDASGGNQQGSTVVTNAIGVSNGVFTVTIDPGVGVFNGLARWLEISVRPTGGVTFTNVAPRQPITASPYAITAGAITGTIDGALIAPGTITSTQLAVGAVQAINIATGAVTSAQLAKPPQSGSISSAAMAIDFGQADFNVPFSPPFSNAPIVTLGLQPFLPPSLGEHASLYVENALPSSFRGRFVFPAPVQKLSEAGTRSSLALVNGTPAVCAAGTPASIQYLRATDPTGGNWNFPIKLELDSGGAEYTRLAVINGNPAIAYYSPTGAVKFIRAIDVNGEVWGSAINVVATNAAISDVSLAVVNGNPAIAYAEFPSWDLKYVRATDANGTTWGAPVTVDSAGQVGRNCSLAVVNGNPAISYEDFSNTDLKYVRATDANGAAWGAPVVADAAGGWQTSLAVVNGQPAIGYTHDPGGTQFVRATDANGVAWGTPVSVGDYGSDVSLQIVNGTPAMSFISEGLQYARASDADGTAWRTPARLDTEAGAAGGTSLIVLPTGVPAISYFGQFSFSEPSGTLRLVREPQVSFIVNWIALEP